MVLVSIKNRAFKLFACLLVHFYSQHFFAFTDTYLFLTRSGGGVFLAVLASAGSANQL